MQANTLSILVILVLYSVVSMAKPPEAPSQPTLNLQKFVRDTAFILAGADTDDKDIKNWACDHDGWRSCQNRCNKLEDNTEFQICREQCRAFHDCN